MKKYQITNRIIILLPDKKTADDNGLKRFKLSQGFICTMTKEVATSMKNVPNQNYAYYVNLLKHR